MGAPKAAFGTVLKSGDAGTPTETFTTIPNIRNLAGPGLGLETIDTTSHSSTGNVRSIIASFKTSGEVTFDLLYDSTDAQHTQIMTDYEGRTKTNYQLIYTDTGAEQWDFAAFITGFSASAPIDDALTVAVTLSIDGAVTRS